MTVRAVCPSGNLIANGTVEAGSPASWAKGGTIGAGQLTWATDYYLAGGHSLKIDDNSASLYGSWYQYVNLTNYSGKYLQFKWSWKYSFTGGSSVSTTIFFCDANNAVLSSYGNYAQPGTADWTTTTMLYPIPATCAYVTVCLNSAGGGAEQGQVWFDDISAILVDAPFNLLTNNIISNGDMETGSPANWSKGGNLSAGQMTWATDQKIAGSYSLKIDDNSSSKYGQWYQYITIPGGSDGKDLKVRWSWKCAMSSGQSQVVLYFLNSAYSTLAQYSYTIGGTTDWTTLNQRLLIPATTTYLLWSLQSAGDQTEQGQVWMDNVSAAVDSPPGGISQIAAMSDDPSPYQLRNWKQVATNLDAFVYNFYKTGSYLPTIWWDGSPYNYPATGYGISDYIGQNNFGLGANNHGSFTCMGLDIGASLCGVNKSNQGGYDFVSMEEKYNDIYYTNENVFAEGIPSKTGTTFWQDLLPSAQFFQLAYLYPSQWPNQATEMASTANQWYAALAVMGGTVSPYAYPNLNHTGFALGTMTAYDNATDTNYTGGTWTEPDSGGLLGWIEYMYYKKTATAKYLTGAKWSMDWIQNCTTNPLYDLSLYYAPITAVRMNCEQGTSYDVTKILQWCVNGNNINSLGPQAATWGGYSVDGLFGNSTYVFEFETIQDAMILAPVARYNQKYAAAMGKYLLNVANNSRLFYPYVLDSAHQTSYSWASTYDPTNSCIGYEGVKNEKLTNDRVSADYSTGPGTIATNDYTKTKGAFNDYEVFQESLVSGDARLAQIWTLPLSSGYFHLLVMTAQAEIIGTGGDTGFNIYWSSSASGPWTGPVFTIGVTNSATGKNVYWTTLNTSASTIYIRATDNASSVNGTLNKLDVDDIYVRTLDSSVAPYSSGDALSFLWGHTDLGIYGSGQIGFLGCMVSPTDVDKILQIDLLKTDFYHDTANPTFLYYNPYDDAQTVTINVGASAVDVYNTVPSTFILTNVTSNQTFSLAAKTAAVLVLSPAGGAVTVSGTKLSVGGVVEDYQHP